MPPPPLLQLADGPEYEVASILDSKIVRKKLYYLVDWLGYPPSHRTWEPVLSTNSIFDIPTNPAQHCQRLLPLVVIKGGIVSQTIDIMLYLGFNPGSCNT